MKRYITLPFAFALWFLAPGVAARDCDDLAGAVTGPAYDERIEEHLDHTALNYEIDDDGDFLITFSYTDGRSQLVMVNSGTERYLGMELREIWTLGYVTESPQIDEAIMRYLINANADFKLGAWQVESMSDISVASFRAIIDADAGVDTLMAALFAVGAVGAAAENMEADLTSEDEL